MQFSAMKFEYSEEVKEPLYLQGLILRYGNVKLYNE